MRFYPNADVYFQTEYSDGWDRYCRWPHKSWAKRDLNPRGVVNHWRDLAGSQQPEIKLNDLYFPKWIKSRIRAEACLPIFYAVGNRFIRITRAFPAGFKCAPVPLNLSEARAVRAWIKEEARQRRIAIKEALKAKKLAKKLAEKGKRRR